MAAVWSFPKPVSCDYCGAVAATPHGNPFGMCENCHRAFQLWNDFEAETEGAALSFLANTLRLTAERALSIGVTGKCECAAKSGPNYGGPRIYQCVQPAKLVLQDGHKVCMSHARRIRDGEAMAFVPVTDADAFNEFLGPVRKLATANPDFRAALERAIA